MQIAFTVESDKYTDDHLAFAAAAMNAQSEEFCSLWRLPFVPVAFYRRATSFDDDVAHAIQVVDDIQSPGLLGYHEFFGGAAVGRVLALPDFDEMTAVFSHEVCELIADPQCNIWRPLPPAARVAQEVSDPVQADVYDLPVAVLGETRSIKVSNYVLPSWFQEDGARPFDKMGLVTKPFEVRPGGYIIVRDDLGIRNVFADNAMPQTFGRKMANARSRTLQRMRSAA